MKNVSVSMVNTRSNEDEQKIKGTIEKNFGKRKSALVAEVDLETPEQRGT